MIHAIAVLISNWYLIFFIPTVAFTVSYIYTHRIPDIYAAKAQILLKSNETYDYQQQIYRGLGFNSKYASYEETASQMRIINSSNLIENILSRIPLNVSYFIVGRLKVTEVYEHMPFRVISDDRSAIYSGMIFQLNIIDEDRFSIQYEMNGENLSGAYSFNELILDNGLFLRVERQRNLNETSLESLSQINYMFKVYKNSSLIAKYKSNIEVVNLDYTSIVEITLKDEISDRALEVLDTLSNVYVETTLDSKKEVNENTLRYIDKQLDEVIMIINDIESELEKYKEQKAILNLTKEEDAYFKQFVELEAQKRNLILEIGVLEDLTTYLLQNESIESLLPPSMFIVETDPQLKQAILDLIRLRSEHIQRLEFSTEKNPSVSALLGEIAAAKRDILGYIQGQKGALNRAIKELDVQIAEFEGRIMSIPKTQRQILNIERRLLVNEDLYSFLLSKRAETVIARAGLVPETKIIEKARAIGVVYPDKQRINLIVFLFGLGFSLLIVFIRETFFRKIQSLGELQSKTELSVLGSIPKLKNFTGNYRIVSGNEKGEVAQAFRLLRTNLQYFAPDKSTKRILVTSLEPSEGKTFTSVNLASVFAIAGKRVLIIDFDLHKPRLYKAMDLVNDRGISSFLVGKSKINEIIQHTEIEHLDVVCSGPIPPNASELIMKDQLNELFDYADEHYDYVFFDTPPITLITDGIFLMRKADVRIFLLNTKSTSKTRVEYIEKLVSENHFDYSTLILNEEKQSRLSYYYSRYGYGGYGYGGYGYGYGGHGYNSYSDS